MNPSGLSGVPRRGRATPASPKETELGSETGAFLMAKKFVADQLRSPGSAEFPWFDFQGWRLGNGHYKIVSYVDSQNAFGALIRTNYVCEVKTEDGTNWSLIDLTMQPQ